MAKEDTNDKKERFKHSIELATTIIIALATIASAWCAYQATLWGGIQTFRLSAVNALGRKSSEQTVRAGQMRTIDGILFIEYLKGKERHRDFLADFFISVSGPKRSGQRMHGLPQSHFRIPWRLRILLLWRNTASNRNRKQNA